jgi:cell fate regulator YaaT (PSP1 superfamily)
VSDPGTPTAQRQQPTRNIAGVKLSPTGRTLECDAGALTVRAGDRVMIEDRRALLLAVVAVASAPRPERGPLGRIVRRADERDLARFEAHRQRESEAIAFARERARARKLSVKVFRAELSSHGDRALIYFSSDQRVDFRELVKDLSAHLHARIEMRQVGVRDEAKMVGGIGSCGRELCCTTFLPQFAPISIKMAKNQNLALNPSKVSGQCGRLKCCLVYEEAMYVEAAKQLPRVGKRVETPEGPGRVDDLDILRGRIRVSYPDRPPAVFTADQVRPLAGPAAAAPPEPPEPGPGPDGDSDGDEVS